MLQAVAGVPAVTVEATPPVELPPLSSRLNKALDDWAEFFDGVDAQLSPGDVADEFVGQGFKLAHRLRAECKGFAVDYLHPVTGETIRIVRNA